MPNKNAITIGGVDQPSNREFTAFVEIANAPELGALVFLELGNQKTFGVVVGTEFTTTRLDKYLAQQGRNNRNRASETAAEVQIVTVGYTYGQTISHQLPPKPPLASLGDIKEVPEKEFVAFTKNIGYLRHLFKIEDAEVLGAHIARAAKYHSDAWVLKAIDAVMSRLKKDFDLMMDFAAIIQSVFPEEEL